VPLVNILAREYLVKEVVQKRKVQKNFFLLWVEQSGEGLQKDRSSTPGRLGKKQRPNEVTNCFVQRPDRHANLSNNKEEKKILGTGVTQEGCHTVFYPEKRCYLDRQEGGTGGKICAERSKIKNGFASSEGIPGRNEKDSSSLKREEGGGK